MLTVKDVAERYAVGLHTVLAWIRSGQLRAMNMGRTIAGRKPRWRIREADLEAFEVSRTQGPQVPKVRRTRPATGVIQFYK